jgi:antirestriction protein ArdC
MKITISDKTLTLFTDLMVQKLEEVSSDWKQPWFPIRLAGLPQNIVSNATYRGMNALFLYMICDRNKYSTPLFMTFNQAKKEGVAIKRGEKSFPVLYWNRSIKDATGKTISVDDYNQLPDEEKKECTVKGFMKEHRVFNADQTNFAKVHPEKWEKLSSGYKPIELKDTQGMFACPPLDELLRSNGWLCPILQDSDKAVYRPSTDEIHVPLKGQFYVGESFYTTFMHEMAHSTGAASRLNRPKGTGFGTPEYAKEELIAELTAALCACTLGISTGIDKENAQYIKGWLEAVKEDPKFLYSILTDVGRASKMIQTEIDKMEMGVKEERVDVIAFDSLKEIYYDAVILFQDPATNEYMAFDGDARKLNVLCDIQFSNVRDENEGLWNRVCLQSEGIEAVISQLINNGEHVAICDDISLVFDKKEERLFSVDKQFDWDEKSEYISVLNPDLFTEPAEETYMERLLTEQKHLTFMGDALTGAAKVGSAADVAFLFKNLESAANEHAFAVMVKEDGSYSVLYIGTGTSDSCTVDPKMIATAAVEMGAETVYFVHNHPSGSLNPSLQDKKSSASLARALEDVGVLRLTSVIINLDSGKYTIFFGESSANIYDRGLPSLLEKDIAPPIYAFDRMKLYMPTVDMPRMYNSSDVAEYLSKQKRGTTPKLGVIVLNNRRMITRYALIDPTGMTQRAICSRIIYEVGKHGQSVILSSNSKLDNGLAFLIQSTCNSAGIKVDDIIQVKQEMGIIKSYKSCADEGLLLAADSKSTIMAKDKDSRDFALNY